MAVVKIIPFLLFLLAVCGCRKKAKHEVRQPVACMTSDRVTASPGDTITFTDCSKYAVTWSCLYFPHEQKDPRVIITYSFDDNRQFKRTFPVPGVFLCVVEAAGANGTRIARDTLTFIISE